MMKWFYCNHPALGISITDDMNYIVVSSITNVEIYYLTLVLLICKKTSFGLNS